MIARAYSNSMRLTAVAAMLLASCGDTRSPDSTAEARSALAVSAVVWIDDAKVTASDGAAQDQFGESVAIDAARAVVGSHMDDDNGMQSGSAYVFQRNSVMWSQAAKLKASDAAANDRFGSAVALEGNTIVVGAHGNYDAGGGAAYVFVKPGSSWMQQAILTSSDPAANWFGAALSLSGDTLLVGAPTTSNIGAGYVFVWDGTAWSEQAKLTEAGKIGFDAMGRSVSIDGDTAVLGDPQEDDAGTNSGAAYVFTRSGGVWSLEAKLVGPDSVADDGFGEAVFIAGDTVMVGAIGHDFTTNASGAVYVFDRGGGTWPMMQKLTASVPGFNDWLGSSIAIDGDVAIIGARGDASVLLFERTNGMWAETLKVSKFTGVFGRSVGLSGTTAIVGAPLDNDKATSAGAAYLGLVVTPAGPGTPCMANAACISGYCVDGVCCDSACGGGASDDCQACSIAAGSTIDGACSVVSSAVVCRPAAGACDAAESCDGLGAACPADGFLPAGSVCRPVADDCDVEESCDGLGTACPADGFLPAGTICRLAAGACDIAEACKGTSAACPVDALEPLGAVCRPAAGDCDAEEACDGINTDCPSDAVEPAGTECRPAAGDCDMAEPCDGTGASCPADALMPDGSACDDGNSCTENDACAAGTCVAGMDICTGQGGSGGATSGSGGATSGSGGSSSTTTTASTTAGAGGSIAGAGGSSAAGGDSPTEPSGCGCHLAESSRTTGLPAWLPALLALAAALTRRSSKAQR